MSDRPNEQQDLFGEFSYKATGGRGWWREERGSSATTGLGNLAASFTSASELHEGDCRFRPLT